MKTLLKIADQKDLAKSKDINEIKERLRNPNAAKSELIDFMHSPNQEIRSIVANHPNSPNTVKEKASKEPPSRKGGLLNKRIGFLNKLHGLN